MAEITRSLSPTINFTATSWSPSEGTTNLWRVAIYNCYLRDLGNGDFKVTGKLRYTVLDSYMYENDSVSLRLKNSGQSLGSMQPRFYQNGDTVDLPGETLKAKDFPNDIKMENGKIKSISLSMTCPIVGNPGERVYEFILNANPTLTLDTTDSRTLYENDVISIAGNAKDTDSGNIVTVKYNINGGTTRAIATAISDGSNIPYNKSLVFKKNRLYDGASAVTADLAEGTQHTLKVWAEDDQGGKSEEQTRVFYVVPNRPANLTINPFNPKTDLIDTDRITISGNVLDPDNNNVRVSYKIANGSFKEIYNGSGGDFEFQVQLIDLAIGKNTITIQAEDTYGAKTVKTLEVTKSKEEIPLLTSVARYKLNPPNGTAKGVVLWIEREVGDLVVDVEINMGMNGEEENFVPMTKSSTAFVTEGIEEDEWTFESDGPKENIILKITMNRTSPQSNKGITLISGVLS